jgi:hypothetical protein
VLIKPARPCTRPPSKLHFSNTSPSAMPPHRVGILQSIPTSVRRFIEQGGHVTLTVLRNKSDATHSQAIRTATQMDNKGAAVKTKPQTRFSCPESYAPVVSLVSHNADQKPARIADRLRRDNGCRSGSVGRGSRGSSEKTCGTLVREY